MGAAVMLVVGFFVVGVGAVVSIVLPDEIKNKIVEKANKF